MKRRSGHPPGPPAARAAKRSRRGRRQPAVRLCTRRWRRRRESIRLRCRNHTFRPRVVYLRGEKHVHLSASPWPRRESAVWFHGRSFYHHRPEQCIQNRFPRPGPQVSLPAQPAAHPGLYPAPASLPAGAGEITTVRPDVRRAGSGGDYPVSVCWSALLPAGFPRLLTAGWNYRQKIRPQAGVEYPGRTSGFCAAPEAGSVWNDELTAFAAPCSYWGGEQT